MIGKPESWSEESWRKLAITLMVVGLAAFVCLMLYIGFNRFPSLPVVLLTLFSWVIFFIGKSMLKSRGSHEVEAEADSQSDVSESPSAR